ncbi:MAG: ABC-type transport auxiliary lipoprotein family protein [Beijerinckiaceae bacterium]|nr:ABC-type transport auxiliary lipoprotein family protein [Beijerinckiaceae bacterium]
MAGLFITAAGLAVSACGTPPSPTFDLSAARDIPPRKRGGLSGQLIVYEPVTLAVYDSDRLVVKGRTQGLTYLPGAQWADRLPRLVQTRMIQSFENANRFKSVGRPGDQISATMVLNTEIRAFQIEEETREALVEISAKVIGQGSGQIQRAQLFTVRIPVTSIDAGGATTALDEALRQALAQIVGWTAR